MAGPQGEKRASMNKPNVHCCMPTHRHSPSTAGQDFHCDVLGSGEHSIYLCHLHGRGSGMICHVTCKKPNGDTRGVLISFSLSNVSAAHTARSQRARTCQLTAEIHC